MRTIVLASGSQGNAILVKSGSSAILFDLGISLRKLKFRLAELNEDLSGLEAVFISHEHGDHINGLEIFLRKIPLPVFATQGTWDSPLMSGLKQHRVCFKCGEPIPLNGFEVQAFRLPHDAAEPVGFIVSDREHKLALATDFGSVNALVLERLKGAELLIIESNHDEDMLRKGPYPWPLKQRILSRCGHLSNPDCARLLSKIQNHGLKNVVLAHLSEKNNRPELAYAAARDRVDQRIPIHLTNQKRPGPIIDLK